MALFGTISMISFCGPRRFVSGPFQFCSVMAVKSESSDPIQQLHAYFDTAPKILKLCFKNFCLFGFVCLSLVGLFVFHPASVCCCCDAMAGYQCQEFG